MNTFFKQCCAEHSVQKFQFFLFSSEMRANWITILLEKQHIKQEVHPNGLTYNRSTRKNYSTSQQKRPIAKFSQKNYN